MNTNTHAAPISLSNDLLTGSEWDPVHTRGLLHLSAHINAHPGPYDTTLQVNSIDLIFHKSALRTATPPDYEPAAEVVADGKRVAREPKAKIVLMTDPHEAVAGAQGVYTDSWTSMGFEEEGEVRNAVFKPYQVNAHLMSLAALDAVFMHCLPAHRGLEVTPEILDGPRSVVLDQSENRMYVQKAILHTLF